jgi:hypothetical protein
MTLVANAFFLSFSTLWRYLMVLPFVAIPGLAVVFSLSLLVVGGGVVFLVLFSPLLVGTLLTLVMIFLITSFSCFNIMVGCRAAFGAMGRVNELDFGRLVGKSMTFTLLQMAVSVFLVVVAAGVFASIYLLAPEGTLSTGSMMANPQQFMAEVATHPATLAVAAAAMLASLGLSALLSVPMAGSAISATPKMGPTDPFLGIGTAFFPVFVVLIATGVLCTVTGAYAMSAGLISMLISNAILLMSNQPMIWPELEFTLLSAAMTLLVIWASCWFYAAAALGWKRYTDQRDAAVAATAEYERFNPEELRALREKRDRERSGGGGGGH